jgi:hypothetical protein
VFFRVRSLLISLTILLGVSGCSQIKFAYNHAHWLILPKLKSYTDFDKAQEEQIESEFMAYMAWHRKTMLPSYAKLLRRTARAVERPGSFDLAMAVSLRTEFKLNFDQTIDPFLAGTARVLATVTDKQADEQAEVLTFLQRIGAVKAKE